MDKNFFKVLNYYIYNDYLDFKGNLSGDKERAFFIIPYYYYNHDFAINYNTDDYIIKIISDNKFNIYEYVLENNSDYLFLFGEGQSIENPEFLSGKNLLLIDELLKKDNNNFYALSAYTTYYYNKGNLDLDNYFQKLLKIDNNNPYTLIKYSRYQASALYKKYKDKKYLILGKNNIILAIDQFKNKQDIPTFFYSWLGYIEHELGDYDSALKLFDITINLNIDLGAEVPEPYAWKVFSLNKIGKYNESIDLANEVILDDILNFDNDKRDFRLFKVQADNFSNIGNSIEFYNNLKITVEKYLSIFSFHINNIIAIDIKNLDLNTDNIILNNRFKAFLDYNNKNIKSDIDKVIFILAFFYKEYLLGEKVLFNDSRGIELLCYNYLKLVYEGKYN
ncbi:MAG: hypothetical protein PHV23_03360 [Candidatus Gracilibacteria bacterium]|nr:hypothetical protein [Candidatus Gracilibacteria bacterium]